MSNRNASALLVDRKAINIERPPLRYVGAKWRIAQWVIDSFPGHDCYVEAFGGGAGVLLQKPPSAFEVYNDLDYEVVTFFDVLRARPEDLIHAISLTPYSREEMKRARFPVDDPLETARRFYVKSWQSFSPSTSSRGWRYQVRTIPGAAADVVKLWNATDHLWAVAERMKQVQIECDDAYKVIERYDAPETLFYLDYPYVHSTRERAGAYKCELSDDDHRRFADLVRSVKGMVIVSGYPSALYDELYRGWHCISKGTSDLRGNEKTECLWLSPRATEVNRMPLFDMAGRQEHRTWQI